MILPFQMKLKYSQRGSFLLGRHKVKRRLSTSSQSPFPLKKIWTRATAATETRQLEKITCIEVPILRPLSFSITQEPGGVDIQRGISPITQEPGSNLTSTSRSSDP